MDQKSIMVGTKCLGKKDFSEMINSVLHPKHWHNVFTNNVQYQNRQCNLQYLFQAKLPQEPNYDAKMLEMLQDWEQYWFKVVW